jgi:hypothetical protein
MPAVSASGTVTTRRLTLDCMTYLSCRTRRVVPNVTNSLTRLLTFLVPRAQPQLSGLNSTCIPAAILIQSRNLLHRYCDMSLFADTAISPHLDAITNLQPADLATRSFLKFFFRIRNQVYEILFTWMPNVLRRRHTT